VGKLTVGLFVIYGHIDIGLLEVKTGQDLNYGMKNGEKHDFKKFLST